MSLETLIDLLVAVAPAGQQAQRRQALQAAAQAIRTAADPAAWQSAVDQFQAQALSVITTYLRQVLPGAMPGLPALLTQLTGEMDDLAAGLRRPLSLGPLTLTVEIAVASVSLAPPGGAPVSVPLALLPPTGFGLALQAGPVAGGGVLSFAGGRLGGALRLKVMSIDVFAFGLIESAGGRVSFVAVLGARFPTGIQLGFGFMLTGVGGLFGLDRRAEPDLLRERLASGASGNVLFCDNPVQNAPALLDSLGLFFPRADGGTVAGLTLQLAWLSLVRLDIALIITLPGPAQIIALGSARVLVGATEQMALISLRMDFVGVIDLAREEITFDAALVNSAVLGILTISGGAAFRLRYGTGAYFLFSIGGFHPAFNPGAIPVPRLARAGASLSLAVVAKLWLRLEMYVAFTANTFQLGAHVEAGMRLGPLQAHGFFAFDALIQFRPFYFDAAFRGGFDIEAAGFSFASVTVEGRMSGPGPLVIYARGSVKRFGLKLSGSATFRLGEAAPDQVTAVNIAKALCDEMVNTANLRAEGDDREVLLEPGRTAPKAALVTPTGSLIWEQKRTPLKTTITRFAGVDLGGEHHLVVTCQFTTTDETDAFSPGTYMHLDASEALNNAAFQSLPSGLRVASAGLAHGPVLNGDTTIDIVRLPELPPIVQGHLMLAYLSSVLITAQRERSFAPRVDGGPPRVKVTHEIWSAYAKNGSVLAAAETPIEAFQQARRTGGAALPATQKSLNLGGV